MSKSERVMAELGANMAESSAPAPPAGGEDSPRTPAPRPAKMVGVERSKDVAQIALGRIMADPDQPRKEFGVKDLERLAESLKAKGQLQPIRVRWSPEDSMYKVIMGERRFRAAGLAGLSSLACVIHEAPLSAVELLAIQVVENVHRDDLKPVEQARALARMKEEFGWSQARMAEELGISQGAVAKSLALLKLSPEIQEKVDAGVISKAAGRAIARVDSPEAQALVATEVESGGLDHLQAAEVAEAATPRRPRSKKPAGRGRRAAKLTSKIHNQDGFKIEARRGRGFELPELRDVVAGFLSRLDDEIGRVA